MWGRLIRLYFSLVWKPIITVEQDKHWKQKRWIESIYFIIPRWYIKFSVQLCSVCNEFCAWIQILKTHLRRCTEGLCTLGIFVDLNVNLMWLYLKLVLFGLWTFIPEKEVTNKLCSETKTMSFKENLNSEKNYFFKEFILSDEKKNYCRF